ncbi:MAG: hypothetical protein AB7I48_27880 [Planctomycetaceae bacterium]
MQNVRCLSDATCGQFLQAQDAATLQDAFSIAIEEVAGEAEIRYVSGKTREILQRQPLRVAAATAQLTLPASATANEITAIEWTGPNNPRDRISIVSRDAEARDFGAYKYTNFGRPARIRAPKQPGEYEVRYVTGQSHQILAREPLTITVR